MVSVDVMVGLYKYGGVMVFVCVMVKVCVVVPSCLCCMCDGVDVMA